MDLTAIFEYLLPHAGIAGLLAAAGGFWLTRHEKQDDKRFEWLAKEVETMNKKLDGSLQRSDDHHAEILKLLIKHDK
jgi:hypothetical protein